MDDFLYLRKTRRWIRTYCSLLEAMPSALLSFFWGSGFSYFNDWRVSLEKEVRAVSNWNKKIKNSFFIFYVKYFKIKKCYLATKRDDLGVARVLLLKIHKKSNIYVRNLRFLFWTGSFCCILIFGPLLPPKKYTNVASCLEDV